LRDDIIENGFVNEICQNAGRHVETVTGPGSVKKLVPCEYPTVKAKYLRNYPSMAFNASGIILMKIGNVPLVNDSFLCMAGQGLSGNGNRAQPLYGVSSESFDKTRNLQL
jgi:hypothetical protein